MSAPDPAALLEALPRGRRIWLTTRGKSLWPLLRGGEPMQVERVDEVELRRGDVAILVTAAGALVAHVVTGVHPLRTASFRGTEDPPGWRALGRVTAVRIGSTPRGLPSRAALWPAQ